MAGASLGLQRQLEGADPPVEPPAVPAHIHQMAQHELDSGIGPCRCLLLHLQFQCTPCWRVKIRLKESPLLSHACLAHDALGLE